MTGHVSLINFFYIYQNSDIDFCFFPLNYDDFNLAKSNISWLETTIAGGGFYTNLYSKEFDYKGIGKNIIELMDMTIDQIHHKKYEMWQQSVKDIKENFDILKVNQKRKNIIDELCRRNSIKY